MKMSSSACSVHFTALVIFAFLPYTQNSTQLQPLTAVSYGGSYARAEDRGYHERFEAETGIKTNLEDFTGGLAQTCAQVEIGTCSGMLK